MCPTGETGGEPPPRRAGGVSPPLAWCLLLVPPSLADVPALDRTRPHFYGAVADRGPVAVAWSAAPRDGDTALTLAVTGLANPGEVRKPDLKPLLAGRFQVLDAPDPPAGPGERRFGWTLRAVPGGAAEVPGLAFAYYRPGFPEGRRFPLVYADPLAIPVAPPPAAEVGPPLPAVPPAGPGVPGWAWLVPPALVLPLARLGAGVARRLFPDAARRAELGRVAAVRAVLRAIDAAPQSADPAGATAAAVRVYLPARPPADPAPFAGLLARCDAARFAPHADTPGVGGRSLPVEAAGLVRRAEAGRS